MNMKKVLATLTALAVAVGLLAVPVTTQAAERMVTVNNTVKDIAFANIQTPDSSARRYAGLTWQQLTMGQKLLLNVNESYAGADAKAMVANQAAALGGTVVKYLDMDLEKTYNGWKESIEYTAAPIRVSVALPNGADQTKDYAIVALGDGKLAVWGDLDVNANSITVDASTFDVWAIVAGKKGAFDAYKIANPKAMTELTNTTNQRKIGNGFLDAANETSYIYDLAIINDKSYIETAVGKKPSLKVTDARPGKAALAALQAAEKASGAKIVSYQKLTLKNGGTELAQTAYPLTVALTAPYHMPAYGDFAVAVLHLDGSVSIVRDQNPEDSIVQFTTQDFREFVVLWGPEGTFAAY